jgi:hypothetical protein
VRKPLKRSGMAKRLYGICSEMQKKSAAIAENKEVLSNRECTEKDTLRCGEVFLVGWPQHVDTHSSLQAFVTID